MKWFQASRPPIREKELILWHAWQGEGVGGVGPGGAPEPVGGLVEPAGSGVEGFVVEEDGDGVTALAAEELAVFDAEEAGLHGAAEGFGVLAQLFGDVGPVHEGVEL